MVNQVQLHTRLAQEELVAYCHERNMVVTAFCPLSGSDLGDPVVRARALPD
jgi:diketogulonate reductase-like aldo/keto reductase